MLRFATLAVLALLAVPASADVFRLAWDPVDDVRVQGDPAASPAVLPGIYEVCWGNATKVYDKGCAAVTSPAVTAATPELGKGTWFFAVKACQADKALCSPWSNEVSRKVLGPIAAPSGMKVDGVTIQLQFK